MRSAQLNGIDVYYEVHGSAHDFFC